VLPRVLSVVAGIGGRAAPVCDLRHIFAFLGAPFRERRGRAVAYRCAGRPPFTAELIALKVDVIVTTGTPASLAVKKAATSIPLVMVAVGDPVDTGLVASLGRPGGNPAAILRGSGETASLSTLSVFLLIAFEWRH